ncbi:unnamed protein product [Phytophthora fragariaefolia]|uniref:Unnamed protein product n=1 Tax=Phytophthora fragariaefolia TaxID=1490495 RepID=A0A9W7DB82_9STRA|nr:unnamed protein product [Phytophthora fragariaefolia]
MRLWSWEERPPHVERTAGATSTGTARDTQPVPVERGMKSDGHPYDLRPAACCPWMPEDDRHSLGRGHRHGYQTLIGRAQ